MRPRYILDAASFHASVTLGQTRENKVLEFKERYGRNDDSRTELRKDVAALANTFGGAILVGVEESRDAGYTRALRLADPDVGTTSAWVDQALASRVYPVPDYSLAVISVPELAPHDILAINIRPYPDGLAAVEINDESLRFPVRSEDRVRFLRAPEVVRAMTHAASRRIVIALNELAQDNQKVHLASPVYLVRLETQPEYKSRLRNQFEIRSWNGPNPPVPREHVEVRLLTLDAHLGHYDDRQVTLSFDGKMLAIPLSVVRDVWLHASGGLGMMLDCDTLISTDPEVGVALRSR